jgi:alkylresorcinol/alkylpyrone synthase
MVPAWDFQVRKDCNLPADVVRVPITQAGCSGGGLAIARAAEYLQTHPRRSALAVSVELCSLAFQADCDPGNLVSTLLFGDSAGAALLEVDAPDGLEVLGARSVVVPDTEEAIGFDLTDNGFFPRLALDLADLLAPKTVPIVEDFLAAHELRLSDVSFFLLHPGGPRILDRLQDGFAISESALRWSFDSLSNLGNTSSAAIFDVIERYLLDANAPSGWGLIIAFGPGISIELLLVHRS